MMVGRLLSFWDGIFSGAMLNFQGVSHYLQCSKYPSVGAAFLPSTDIEGILAQGARVSTPGEKFTKSVAKSSHAAEQVGSKNSVDFVVDGKQQESSGVNSPVEK